MTKRQIQFEIDSSFTAARRAASDAAQNINSTRAMFQREYVTYSPSMFSRFIDLIKGVLAI